LGAVEFVGDEDVLGVDSFLLSVEPGHEIGVPLVLYVLDYDRLLAEVFQDEGVSPFGVDLLQFVQVDVVATA
jgi:hypothetical protein